VKNAKVPVSCSQSHTIQATSNFIYEILTFFFFDSSSPLLFRFPKSLSPSAGAGLRTGTGAGGFEGTGSAFFDLCFGFVTSASGAEVAEDDVELPTAPRALLYFSNSIIYFAFSSSAVRA
jgi:hypothetical protein